MTWASDTFTGTPGTTIIGQGLAEGGGTWEAGANSGGLVDCQYQSGGGAQLTVLTSTYYLINASNTPPSADYVLTGSFTLASSPGANDSFGVIARSSSFDNANIGYWFQWRGAGNVGFHIANGFSVALSSLVTPSLAGGIGYTITAVLNGTALAMSVQRSSDSNWLAPSGTWQSEQTTCCTATDGTYSAAGSAGFWLSAEDADPKITEWSGADLAASFVISPTSGATGTTPTITATGTGTAWVNGTTEFSVSGGTGASCGTTTVSSTTSASFVLTVGSATGTLTIANNTDSATAPFTATSAGATISVNDSHWFYSPCNWFVNGSESATTNTCGAYFKIGFTGTSVALNVDVSALVSAGASAGEYPYLRWSVDLGPWQTVQLTSSTTSVPLASSLASGTHQLWLNLVSTQWNLDKWDTPVSALVVTSLGVDEGAVSAAPLELLAGRAIIIGDSITEGHDAAEPINSVGPASPANDDAMQNWSQYCCYALGAEFGQIGFGSQGWTVDGAGNVPPVFTPGNDTASSWDKYFLGQSRLTGGSFVPTLNYLLVLQGKNDNGASGVPASIEGFLPAARAAAGTNCRICVIIPFDGTSSAQVTSGFNSYQAATVDANCKLINIGDQAGLAGSPSCNSYDGTHPNGRMHGQLGAEVAQAIQAAFGGSTPPTPEVSVLFPDPRAASSLDELLDGINSLETDAGELLIYSGPAPDHVADPATGTLLATLTLIDGSVPAFGATNPGTLIAIGYTSGGIFATTSSASATGLAGYWRILDYEGTPVCQGSAGGLGSGADLILSSSMILASNPVTVTSFQLTISNIV